VAISNAHIHFSKPWEKSSEEVDIDVLDAFNCRLIVWNDEVNTFEWVIETLVDVCGHSHDQAEQCAMIIHIKGKYAVKEGDFETLKPMREAITERGIQATIDQTGS
jgi:ATP-dependent Clp protease adaptor protein ClpS